MDVLNVADPKRFHDMTREIHTTVGSVEEEWKDFKFVFVGVAEELCGRTSRKGIITNKENQTWWTEEVAVRRGLKLIYKMARERDEDSKDVKTGSVIKDKNGKLVTDRKDVLKVWEEYFKELLNQRENSEQELPSTVEGQVKLEEIGDAEVERAM